MGNVMAKAADIVKNVVRRIKDTVRECIVKAVHETVRFSINHPRMFKISCYAGGGALVGSALMPVILPLAGFTSGGIAAGSLAAAWQAAIGNVAAGSLFAILTSAGAGGFGVAIAAALAASVGTGMGAASGALAAFLNGRGGWPGPGGEPDCGCEPLLVAGPVNEEANEEETHHLL